MKSNHLLRAFTDPGHPVDLWRAATPAQINLLHAAALDGVIRAKRISWLAGVLAVALLLLPVGAAFHAKGMPQDQLWLGAFLLVGVPLAVAKAVQLAVFAALSIKPWELRWNLRPLRQHSELCHQALELLRVPAVQAYRDEVVAGGRELLVADWKCLSFLGRQVQCAELQARNREACQRLHAISQPQVATS